MIGAMYLVDADGSETSRTESTVICPRQPLEIICLLFNQRRVLIIVREAGMHRRQGRPPKNHPDVMKATHEQLSQQDHIFHTSNHVHTRRTVPSCCSSCPSEAHLYFKAIGHAVTPSFRPDHSPGQSGVACEQLQQMAEHKVGCRRGH